jgi:hypothetical protein
MALWLLLHVLAANASASSCPKTTAEFLAGARMSRHVSVFAAHSIQLRDLPFLNDQHLREIGVAEPESFWSAYQAVAAQCPALWCCGAVTGGRAATPTPSVVDRTFVVHYSALHDRKRALLARMGRLVRADGGLGGVEFIEKWDPATLQNLPGVGDEPPAAVPPPTPEDDPLAPRRTFGAIHDLYRFVRNASGAIDTRPAAAFGPADAAATAASVLRVTPAPNRGPPARAAAGAGAGAAASAGTAAGASSAQAGMVLAHRCWRKQAISLKHLSVGMKHFEAALLTVKRGYQRVLVIEDDVQLLPGGQGAGGGGAEGGKDAAGAGGGQEGAGHGHPFVRSLSCCLAQVEEQQRAGEEGGAGAAAGEGAFLLSLGWERHRNGSFWGADDEAVGPGEKGDGGGGGDDDTTRVGATAGSSERQRHSTRRVRRRVRAAGQELFQVGEGNLLRGGSIGAYVLTQAAARQLVRSLLPFGFPADLQLNFLLNALRIPVFAAEPELVRQGTMTGEFKSTLASASNQTLCLRRGDPPRSDDQ